MKTITFKSAKGALIREPSFALRREGNPIDGTVLSIISGNILNTIITRLCGVEVAVRFAKVMPPRHLLAACPQSNPGGFTTQ
ncbi:MAG: hypothetical protein P8Y60_06440 [Calditrichota bacterium]